MGDGVNIAARLQGVAKPGTICLSEQAYWQVKGRLDLAVTDLGKTPLKNIAEPVHAYSVEVWQADAGEAGQKGSVKMAFDPRASGHRSCRDHRHRGRRLVSFRREPGRERRVESAAG